MPTESRYWVDVPDFPADGIAYETSDHHLSIVKAVAAGQQILPDREALAARFKPVEGPRRTRVAQLADDRRRRDRRYAGRPLLAVAMAAAGARSSNEGCLASAV